MDGIILVAVLAVIGWYFYKVGKRLGSRQGFGAGRARERRGRRR